MNFPCKLRVAAIDFLNPAPLMWDFEHAPYAEALAERYQIERMLPSACAASLAAGSAEIGLIPIAALATTPQLRILPGSTIASKGCVRSLLLVRPASLPLDRLRTVAADAASRTTLAYARILLHQWGNPAFSFLPMAADVDLMLAVADAAILIGDPALLALEARCNRFERSGQELVYHDLAAEWRAVTGLPFVSAVWSFAPESLNRCGSNQAQLAEDFNQSRVHGMENIESLVEEWSRRIAIPQETIRSYLTTNIHYELDEECREGMRVFFRMAAATGVLPKYEFSVSCSLGN